MLNQFITSKQQSDSYDYRSCFIPEIGNLHGISYLIDLNELLKIKLRLYRTYIEIKLSLMIINCYFMKKLTYMIIK